MNSVLSSAAIATPNLPSTSPVRQDDNYKPANPEFAGRQVVIDKSSGPRCQFNDFLIDLDNAQDVFLRAAKLESAKAINDMHERYLFKK